MSRISSRYLITLVSVAVLILVAVPFLADTGINPAQKNGTKVIDCRNQTYTCEETRITQRVEDCPNMWAPWKAYSELNCSYTSNGVESISLVADPANYIPGNLTEESYTSEFFSRTRGQPWDLEFLPNGTPIWTNKKGGIRYREQNSVKVLDRIDVVAEGTTGLLGLAVDPNFTENRYIYVFYNYGEKPLTDFVDADKVNLTDFDDDPSTEERRHRFVNRISRFKLTGQGLENETVLLEEIPSSDHVSGGRLEFGPDGKLYATTSIANLLYMTANTSSLAGKTLRLNTDGSIPDDNPFEDSYVYSRGHKNSIGLAWQPETEDFYASEHGGWRYDEINKIEPGKSYGWYAYRCEEIFYHHHGRYKEYYPGSPKEYFGNTPPERCFKNWTIAPAGMTFIDDPESPWYGDLFVASLRGKHLRRITFDEENRITDGEIFYTSKDEPRISLRLRDVEYRDGSLYVIGGRRGMVKITPDGN